MYRSISYHSPNATHRLLIEFLSAFCCTTLRRGCTWWCIHPDLGTHRRLRSKFWELWSAGGQKHVQLVMICANRRSIYQTFLASYLRSSCKNLLVWMFEGTLRTNFGQYLRTCETFTTWTKYINVWNLNQLYQVCLVNMHLRLLKHESYMWHMFEFWSHLSILLFSTPSQGLFWIVLHSWPSMASLEAAFDERKVQLSAENSRRQQAKFRLVSDPYISVQAIQDVLEGYVKHRKCNDLAMLLAPPPAIQNPSWQSPPSQTGWPNALALSSMCCPLHPIQSWPTPRWDVR